MKGAGFFSLIGKCVDETSAGSCAVDSAIHVFNEIRVKCFYVDGITEYFLFTCLTLLNFLDIFL